MYSELGRFLRQIMVQKSLWTDGELWTSVAGGVLSGLWFYERPELVAKIRSHFESLLTVTGIVFGFALSALVFYIQAIGAWSDDKRVQNVANRLVDWHVWTIICLLSLMGYILTLWLFGGVVGHGRRWLAVEYGFLAFLVLYCGLQIVNHTLTVWWTFRNSNRLRGSKESQGQDD